MIKAIAIDDEPLALKITENFCNECPEVVLEKTFTGPETALKYLNKFPVDLVFLDIQMPSMSGIELAKNIRPEVMIIFTTAFDNFALEGFNLNAIDYLVKPFTKERFLTAVGKALTYKKGNAVKTAIEPFITLRADYSLVKIPVSGIRYIEGLDDYIKIHTSDTKPVVARYTMKSILSLLSEEKFIRVHRSFIVPLNAIRSVKNRSVLLADDLEIPVGQSFEKDLISKFRDEQH
jgi:DNA-binding LytR/AlgR family response regulator